MLKLIVLLFKLLGLHNALIAPVNLKSSFRPLSYFGTGICMITYFKKKKLSMNKNMSFHPRAYCEINLTTYQKNLHSIKKLLGNPETKIMAVVKSNAYGHGILPLSKVAMTSGASYLGVCKLEEAHLLRKQNSDYPVLLMSECSPQEMKTSLPLDITHTLYSEGYAIALNQEGVKRNKRIKIHIKMDTGMGRLGCSVEHSLSLIQKVKALSHLECEGIYTHFSQADNLSGSYTRYQLQVFHEVLEKLKEKNIDIPIKHIANSSATLHFPESHLDMVRIGLASYKNILTLKSALHFIKYAPSQSAIGYGGEFVTTRPTSIGIVTIGYADGLSMTMKEGQVLIRDRFYPIVGRVCMDFIMIDLGEKSINAQVGDEVVLLGTQKEKRIPLEEFCRWNHFSLYEAGLRVSNLIPKRYVS